MAKSNRDEFSQPTKDRLADLAGRLCSYPPCRIPTVGATSDGKGLIKTGVAAHICAAAPGGYRYDVNMSSTERSSIENGIWMCQVHGKAIDSSDPEFTVEKLRKWKRQAEIESWCRVMGNQMPQRELVVAGQASRPHL